MNSIAFPASVPKFQRLLTLWQRIADLSSGARADVRLWQAARADHRVMSECMQASGRDLDDEAGLALSWGRFPEQLPDGRGKTIHLRHG